MRFLNWHNLTLAAIVVRATSVARTFRACRDGHGFVSEWHQWLHGYIRSQN